MRVLFLANIPSPYRVDFFNELGKKCELTVTFEGVQATDRNEKWVCPEIKSFHAVFLKGIRTGSDQFLCADIISVIKKGYDHIIVGGYSTPTGMLAIEYMRFHRIPFWIEADGGLISQDNVIKFYLKKHLISSASGWFSSGKMTTDYLVYYGARREKVCKYPFTSLYSNDILQSVPSTKNKADIKKRLEIKEEKMILSVGRFSYNGGYGKGYDVLMKAVHCCPDQYGLYIIGDEPTDDFIKLKRDLKMDNVHFLPFKVKKELKEYYKASDVFCLQTRGDVWGLAVNEAMAAGLPVITTDRCVAGMELVEDGKTGYVVPPEDEQLLAEKIMRVLEDDNLRLSMGRNGLEKIRYWTIENMAKQHYWELLKENGDQ